MRELNNTVLVKLSNKVLKENGNCVEPQRLNTITIYKHKLPNGGAWITADIQPYSPH